MRRGHVVVVVAALAGEGCIEGFTRGESRQFVNEPVSTPALPQESVAIAARVDRVGRELLDAVPFFPVDPTFHTVALQDLILAHPDLNGVFVSEGVVGRCRSDGELAAILATELGQMAAEKRTADRLRNDNGDAVPNAEETARELLAAAGYSTSDLATVAALLKQAEANRKLVPSANLSRKPPVWSP